MVFEKILLLYWKIIERKDKKRLSQQSAPEGIKVISDIPYVNDAKVANLLDVYYPEDKITALPVIVMVHGGGWTYGNKELNKIYAMNLALRGFAVVNINYHLVQECRFPQQIKDIFSVFNWIETKHLEYNLDKDNVFITGDSAGAHLSSVSLALLHNDKFRKELNVDTNLKIRAGGLICGVFDLDALTGVGRLIKNVYSKVILGESYLNSSYKNHISFIKSIDKKLPPLYLMTSSQDFVKSQTLHLADYLKNNDFNYKLRYWDEKRSKKLIHVFNVCFPLKTESIITNDEMCDFFRQHMV